MKKVTLSVLLLSLLTGFAQADSITTQRVEALGIKDSNFVPVFIGGWGSCDSLRPKQEKKKFGKRTPHKMFLYKQAIRYVRTINKHADKGIEKFVLVCLTKGSQNGFMAQGSIKTLTYNVENQNIKLTNTNPTLVNIDSHQDNTKHIFLRYLPFLDNREHLTTRLLEIADGKPMVLFGHSYGGWIGKRVVEVLASPEVYKKSKYQRDRTLYGDTLTQFKKYKVFPVHTFFSLEGISAVNCRITKSIKAGLQSTMGRKTHPGCSQEAKSFHEELNFDERNFSRSLTLDQTAGKTTNWFNILLDNSTLPTRAGLSTVSNIENVELDIQPYGSAEQYEKSQAHPFKNAHHMLGFHTGTWDKICKLTFSDNPELCNPVENVDNKGRVKN